MSSKKEDQFLGAKISGANGGVYLIQKRIGKGHFAEVYICIDRERKRYACKVIPSKNVKNDREFTILSSVKHENILSLLDVFFAEDHYFVIMPLMRGGELYSKIRTVGHYSEGEARRILRQIARGIEYLHTVKLKDNSVGIAHRDLKPENILCSEEPENFRVVIADFGLSRVFGPEEVMTSACGTPHYVAPEVFPPDPERDEFGRLIPHPPYTQACDIWSFGVIAYILLTGCFPFDAPRNILPSLIRSGRYNEENLSVRGISQPACDLLRKIFSVDPEKRPGAAEILQHPWMVGTVMPNIDFTVSAGLFGSLTPSASVRLEPTMKLEDSEKTEILDDPDETEDDDAMK